jgi:hypothetical protein
LLNSKILLKKSKNLQSWVNQAKNIYCVNTCNKTQKNVANFGNSIKFTELILV